MKQKPVAGFRCYICGEVFPDQTERATPCGYDRFGQATCKACCEKCRDLEPFPCPQYNARSAGKEGRPEKHDLERSAAGIQGQGAGRL